MAEDERLDDEPGSDGPVDGGDGISAAPPLYLRPSYFRQTRKSGKILKTVNERYLRDDLGLGSHFVVETTSSRRKRNDVPEVATSRVIPDASHLLSILRPCKPHALVVCDANVLLHNLDLLEQSMDFMPNVVVPQTSLLECRSNNMVAYDRVLALIRGGDGNDGKGRCTIFFPDQHHVDTANDAEASLPLGSSTNDINDARIRRVASLYATHVADKGVKVVLLTDDAGSRAAAKKEKATYEAKTVRDWVKDLETRNKDATLSDLVAQFGTSNTEEANTVHFPAHVNVSELSRGVQSGAFYRCVFRCMNNDMSTGRVTIRQGEERVAVAIQGTQDCNRAVDGDVVAVALHPLSKWQSSKGISEAENIQAKESKTGIASETAEPTESELSNVPDFLPKDGTDDIESMQPTGKVVGIIRRNFETYSGSIYESSASSTAKKDVNKYEDAEQDAIALKHEKEHPDGSTTCVFFPVDGKIPPILIRTAQRERFLSKRIVVSMDSWPATSPLPLGHYVKTIGDTGAKDVETEVLLQQHKIAHEPFSAAVLACLPPDDYKIEITNDRTDLRHLPILSIDPPGCKDIDDALHCTVLPNGNYQVGVHIADVTHYVKAGSAIDLEAADRSTSTYLVNRRLDMLPSLLTTDLCSLKGNVDRFAFSVLWEVTPDADIVDVDFKKTIIHSIAALTYQQAQTLIEQPGDGTDDVQAGAVKRLASLAKKLRKRRIDAGALTLASPEVKFVLDSESLNPTDVQAYALLEANALVEEFMLLANVTVSKKILRHYPTLSVLRRHPSPNRAMFNSLISKARSRGFEINIETSKQLADSLDAAQIESEPYFNKLLRILSTRCMSPAQYFCSGEFRPMEWHHYGLAAPVYTHFTSPIRRYADVCVHRLLAAAINVAPLPLRLSSKFYLHDLCANMNRRHRAAQLAGRASVQLHTLIFFSGSESSEKSEEAYILDIATPMGADSSGKDVTSHPVLTVIVPRYGIEGKIALQNLCQDDPLMLYEAEKHQLTYDKTVLRVFDRVKVNIWVRPIRNQQRELVLDLLEPKIEPSTKRALAESPNQAQPKSPRKKRNRTE